MSRSATVAPTDHPEWLASFRAANGRPLRVLHLGNIANNAFNNAQMQRGHGIEADAVAYDYFHAMGCAEWESAPIKGTIPDPFYPDWWAVDLGDWIRPEWFIQGPLQACLAALEARHTGNRRQAARARLKLVEANFRIVDEMAAAAGRQRPWTSPYAPGALPTTLRLAGLDPTMPAARLAGLTPAIERLASRARVADLRADLGKALGRRSGRIRAAVRLAAGSALWLALHPVNRAIAGPARFVTCTPSPADERAAASDHLTDYKACHPDVPDEVLVADLAEALHRAAAWRRILPYYDVVQGYSVDALIPQMASFPCYAAYEHGTLRAYPFEPNRQSRLCYFTYAQAPRVMITNTDVLPSADRIGIAPARRVHVPACIDYRRLDAFRAANAHLAPPADELVVFSPTRHHWRRGDGSWLKGNDVLLRAAARVLAEGRRFRLVLVDWGLEVEDSRALIAELGIGPAVRWIAPLDKHSLWSACCRAHVIADQFVLTALGGIGIEALALGRRLITALDRPTLERFFGAAPPVLDAASVDACAERLREVLGDPGDARGVGPAGRSWLERYHSPGRILELQVGAYRELIEGCATARSGLGLTA